MGTRRIRNTKAFAPLSDGYLTVPGAGPGGSDIVIRPSVPGLITTQEMQDANNAPLYPSGLGSADVGCQMSSFKTFYKSGGTGPYEVQGLGRRYNGCLRTLAWTQGSFLQGGAVQAGFSDPNSLFAAGATGVARTIPTHPVAGAAVALAELRREGLPCVPTAATVKTAMEQLKSLRRKGLYPRPKGVHPSDLGDEYLNWQFGWAPIVSDLRKLARSIKSAHSIVDQMDRGSGQNVRRRYEFPTSTETSSVLNEPNTSRTPAFAGDLGYCDVWMMGSGPATWTHEIEYLRKRWFSGCYTYYVPPATDFFGKARRYESYANKILGTRLTPEVVWNLAPWSWAADWFFNLGDIATNFSYLGADGLAMRYGYVLERNTSSIHCSWTGRVNLTGQSNALISIQESFGSQTMQRVHAYPWGFGSTFSVLSPRQAAITAALGISRTGRD